MDPRQLRLRCERAVDALDLPAGLHDPAELCRLVGLRRDRPIQLLPRDTPPSGPCGLAIPGDDRDFVIHEQHTSRPHRFHIIGHEVGHIVFGHEPVRRAVNALASTIAALYHGESQPVGALARSIYAQPDEAEAEEFANILGERAVFAAAGESRRDGALGRVENALRPRRPRVAR